MRETTSPQSHRGHRENLKKGNKSWRSGLARHDVLNPRKKGRPLQCLNAPADFSVSSVPLWHAVLVRSKIHARIVKPDPRTTRKPFMRLP